jgi:hypothetical protein
MVVNALRLSHEYNDLIREGYGELFYGDAYEWTKDNRIEAIPTFGVSIAFLSRGSVSSD